jgi:hypothetical protein
MHAQDELDEAFDAEDTRSREEIEAAQAETEARDFRSLAAASRLIAKRLSGRFIILDDIGHGTIFPDDTEEVSGTVLDERGELYTYWTGWDTRAGRLTLWIWRREEIDERVRQWGTYRRARALLGLDSE